MQEIGFDIISDLDLKPHDSFNWNDKATSLYCIVAGNISTDVDRVMDTLTYLSRFYHGVFFAPGRLEYETATNLAERTQHYAKITSAVPNVYLLHQQVIVIDGVAILGTNGWGDITKDMSVQNYIMNAARFEDFAYITQALTKLQRHLDVKKVIMVTNAVPHDDLYFGERPKELYSQTPLSEVLGHDTEKKVTHWVFGSYNKPVDAIYYGINYLNNPYVKGSPYWPKRLTISV